MSDIDVEYVMSDIDVEKEIEAARQADGTYAVEWVAKMNRAGIWFEFRNDGIRWSRKPFT